MELPYAIVQTLIEVVAGVVFFVGAYSIQGVKWVGVHAIGKPVVHLLHHHNHKTEAIVRSK